MKSVIRTIALSLSIGGLIACSEQTIPASVVQYGVQGGASAGVVQVHSGDTLYRLALRNQVPLKDLIEANNLEPPYALSPGQRLKMPAPRIYIARAGDSYSTVARQFDLSVSELVKLNNSRPPHNLNVGQKILLSSSSAPQKPTAQEQKQKQEIARKVKPKVTAQSLQKPPAASGKMVWPVQGNILSSYGPKQDGLHNDGVNIGAPKGTVVRGVQNGIVAYVGNDLPGFGNLVLVKHDNDYVTAYAHLDQVFVQRGAAIDKGASLGTVGMTGNVKTPQLHFEVRKKGKPIDPAKYLG